jgi:ergothioneine biosynthesis protein EgtB
MMRASDQAIHPREQLLQAFHASRRESVAICRPLQAEDSCIQTMADVSPPKWHLAHTSWFYETFLLAQFDDRYQPYHPAYDYLFNSYYVTHSKPYPRPQRGLLSRPTLGEVLAYRESVDAAMQQLVLSVSNEDWRLLSPLIELGMNHEQQHQELLYTDIKHIFASNPLKPVYQNKTSLAGITEPVADMQWHDFAGGVVVAGFAGEGFAFDNESPQHKTLLQDFSIANRLVTNAEYLQFIEAGGYQQPEYWMSEGWACVQQQHWQAPLYWEDKNKNWQVFGLHGRQPLELNAPVCHVSFYEADAYARWAEKRLPTEFEWESVAQQHEVSGNLREAGNLKPVAADTTPAITQLFGDVWEWTASPYTAYPGYRPASGSIGEYNGKFMSGQMVLRGGSCVTPGEHIRASYRNFFYPQDRWQFSGIRLASEP